MSQTKVFRDKSEYDYYRNLCYEWIRRRNDEKESEESKQEWFMFFVEQTGIHYYFPEKDLWDCIELVVEEKMTYLIHRRDNGIGYYVKDGSPFMKHEICSSGFLTKAAMK